MNSVVMNRFLTVQLQLQLLLLFAAAAQASASGLRSLTTVGTISKLRLIDADTNQPVAGYDPLSPYTVIDVSSLPSSIKNFNVEAVTEGAVGSVQWNDAGRIRNDDFAFWSMCGNSGSDFFACERLKVGANHTIKATPYSGKGASGAMGSTVTIQLAFVQSKTVPPTLTLVNSETDRDIGLLLPDTVIDLSKTPKINVRADPNPAATTKSVQFSLNGRIYRNDNVAPFALNGNSGSNYFDWSPMAGRYNITASTFSERDAKGTLIATSTVSVTVISSAQPLSPKTPIPSPTKAPMVAPVPVVVPTPAPRATLTAAPRTAAPASKAPTVAPKASSPVVAPTAANPPTAVPAAPTAPDLRPKLLSMTLKEGTSTLDVANGQAILLVEVEVVNYYLPFDESWRQSTVSAFRQGNVGEGSAQISGILKSLDPFPGVGIPYLMQAEVTFPRNDIPLGAYNLSVRLIDNSPEYDRLFDSQVLRERKLPYSVTVQNSQNNSIRNAFGRIIISTGSEGVEVYVNTPRGSRFSPILLEQEADKDNYKSANRRVRQSDGGVDLVFTYEYSANRKGRNITFGLSFRSFSGGAVTLGLRSEDLIARGLPGTFEVPATMAPNPRILNMTVLAPQTSVVDIANGPVTLVMEVWVWARHSRVCYFDGHSGSNCQDGTRFELEATCQGPPGQGSAKIVGIRQTGSPLVDREPVPINFTMSFPQTNMPLGRCNLTLNVVDPDMKNFYVKFYDTQALADQNLLSTLTVVNSKVPTPPSALIDFQIIYGPQFPIVKVVCQSSFLIKEAAIASYGINGPSMDRDAFVTSYTTPSSRAVTNVNEAFTFDMDQFVNDHPVDEWKIYNMTLRVFLKHSDPEVVTTLLPNDLRALGFPNATVVFRKQLWI